MARRRRSRIHPVLLGADGKGTGATALAALDANGTTCGRADLPA